MCELRIQNKYNLTSQFTRAVNKMNLLPKKKDDFSEKEYWESFFKKRGEKAFEWYGEFLQLYPNLCGHIEEKHKILMIGCGNSKLSMDMYDQGFTQITNIDISPTVIKQMKSLNKQKRPKMDYLVMDALHMSFPDKTFELVLDKGTLDALVSDNSPEALQRAESLFNEVARVTGDNGRYICISLLQEHILRKIVSYFGHKWVIKIERCIDVEKAAMEKGESGMPVFAVVCTKCPKKKPPKNMQWIQLFCDGDLRRIEDHEELISVILSMQHASFVLNGLSRSSISEKEEIVFELYKFEQNSTPRFTIYVVDSKVRKHSDFIIYSAFIVPQGRELEWLFSTREGRQKLLASAKCDRLAIVSMHREHTYFSLEKVQEELNDHISNLAPPGLKSKIRYLSIGNDLGERELKHKGTSEFSGPFIVEDVKSNDDKFRRLIFSNSQNIIQSEAKLKIVKKKSKRKYVVDTSYIACEHHIYMGLGTHIVCTDNSTRVAVIGLGGGSLCIFLNQYLPQVKVTAVDIDPAMLDISTKWFGLNLSDKMEVKIEDGLKFLEEEANNGNQFDAILFDVDSKDTSLGMSCPPKEFLEAKVMDNVQKLIKNNGLFILNLVLRDENLRPNICKNLKSKFQSVISYKLEEDLNEIFYCKCDKQELKGFEENLSLALTTFNDLCKKKKIQNDKLELQETMERIKIN